MANMNEEFNYKKYFNEISGKKKKSGGGDKKKRKTIIISALAVIVLGFLIYIQRSSFTRRTRKPEAAACK
jgi:hypothetical protein